MSDLEISPEKIETTPSPPVGPQFRRIDSRDVPLGGLRAMTVRRTLPHRSLSAVGAWCFLDEAGPARHLTRVLPHPHVGLQTATWLLAGSIRHRDSLGSDVLIRPGQLDLMTSGDGIAHSEFTPGEDAEDIHLLQLWIALPDASRHRPAGFEQHTALPVVRGVGFTATVFVGEFAGVRSAATVFSPLVGAQIDIDPLADAEIALDPTFEHAILVPRGTVDADGHSVGAGALCYLGNARDRVPLRAGPAGATILLIGGEPLAEDLLMWWNFVARTHDEIVEARDAWEAASDRFGVVDGHDGARIPAPPLPSVRLTPRRRAR